MLIDGYVLTHFKWTDIQSTECIFAISFFKDFICLFLERGEEKEKERERNIMCGCLLCAPHWGPGPQPRHVPWLGTEPATLWFVGPHSVHWATPATAWPATSYSAATYDQSQFILWTLREGSENKFETSICSWHAPPIRKFTFQNLTSIDTHYLYPIISPVNFTLKYISYIHPFLSIGNAKFLVHVSIIAYLVHYQSQSTSFSHLLKMYIYS